MKFEDKQRLDGLEKVAEDLGLFLQESTVDGVTRFRIMEPVSRAILAEYEQVASIEIALTFYSIGLQKNQNNNN